jgi:hypothetical protein
LQQNRDSDPNTAYSGDTGTQPSLHALDSGVSFARARSEGVAMNAHPSNLILNALPIQFNEFRARLIPVPLPVGMAL